MMSCFQNGIYSNTANGTIMIKFKQVLIALVITLLILPLFTKKVASESIPVVKEVIIAEPEEPAIDRMEVLIDAIEKMEGNYAGTIATRNNNPCNLRWGINQLGKKNGFSYFKDYETGRNACRHQITISADGRSRIYNPEMTLLEFFNKYAPSSDNNQPSLYYEFVIKNTGFARDMQIKELLL